MNRRLLIVTALAATMPLAACGQATTTTTTTTTNTVSAAAAPTSGTTAPETVTSEPTTAVSTSVAPSTDAATPAAPRPSSSAPAVPNTTKTANGAAPAAGALPQTNAGDYADAAVAAVTEGDTATAKKYFAPSAIAGVNPATLPKTPLLRTACEDNLCSFASEDGKRVTLTLDLTKVKKGATGAITKVKIG